MNRLRGLLAVLFLSASTLVSAQPAQTGTLSGFVRDTTGGVLPGVSVTATSDERGFSRSAVTDASGKYLFPSLPAGNYSITVSLSGFEPVRISGNAVVSERTTSVSATLKPGGLTEVVEVAGETPIVDMTNTSVSTSVRKEEYEKIPLGRSYQTMLARAPGVVGTGNVNSSGALTSNNQFLMDGIDTTDPTTGTFGSNLNFEAIQEVAVATNGVSAEYGRAVGAVVNVITKSGTNKFEGSAKYIATNDLWSAQNKTKSETTGASLSRVIFEKTNPVYSFTLGGPIMKDKVWFFGAYENSKNTTPQRQTVGSIPEDYQQTTESKFWNVRLTAQVAKNHQVWVKYFESPTNGFVIDYWGAAGERAALTRQDQTADNWAGQWAGVLKPNWTMEASAGKYASILTVSTFQAGRGGSSAPHFNLADSKYYNGATFDGFTNRPRKQGNIATTYFTTIGSNSHSFKLGVDYQTVESGAEFKYPEGRLYLDTSFDQRTGTFVPNSRRDYETGPSVSDGKTLAVYLRDKFEVGKRVFLEAGLRFEKQTGESDQGAGTVDVSTLSPRLSGSFDISGDGKNLIVGNVGRFYQGIIQSFSDAFGAIPQQANYNNMVWNGSAYVLQNVVRVSGSNFPPNTDLKPTYVDEQTIGLQRQFGNSMGVGVRYVHRKWGNLIDDTREVNAAGSVVRNVLNYEDAERSYNGIQFTFERRFSNNWSTQASYTWSKTEGNHFDTVFSALGDYTAASCRTTVDTSIGVNGVLPCSEVQDGANKYGAPTYDRPHNIKFSASYVKRVGRVNLVGGTLIDAISKTTFSKTRTVNVLLPGTLTNAGPTATYYYAPIGSERIPGMAWTADLNFEATLQILKTRQAGLRAEIFNVTDRQEKTAVNSTLFCNSASNATCTANLASFGKATARGSFQTPRQLRFTAVVRF
jgi:Carboxypeptidase regulatory-like domain/TonB-dependent Receptor Plug Domain